MQDPGQGCGSSSLPVERLSARDMILQGPTSHINTPPCGHSLKPFGRVTKHQVRGNPQMPSAAYPNNNART